MLTSTVVLTLLFVSACWDWRRRKVPNGLLIPTIVGGTIFQIAKGDGLTALFGVGTAFLLTLFPVLLKGMGMGDQKLLIAAGVWLPVSELYSLFLQSICVGLLFTLCIPHKWQQLKENLHAVAVSWVAHRHVWIPAREQSAQTLPYAVCLFIAYLFQLLAEGWHTWGTS